MVRTSTSKPYARPEPYRKGNPDSPGAWKHDLHESVRQSLASRLAHSHGSSSSPGSRSLLSRLTDKRGQELLPEGGGGGVGVGVGGVGGGRPGASSKLHGFGVTEPVNRNSNANAGLELLPSTSTSGARTHGLGPGAGTGGSDVRSRIGDSRVVASGLSAAGLSGQTQQQRTRQVRPLAGGVGGDFGSAHGHGYGAGVGVGSGGSGAGVSIAGKARGSVWVRVENLAPETTPDDVVSAFAPSPILSALLSPSQAQATQSRSRLVSIDLEFASRQPAEEIISQYHGVVADGNTLRVTMVRQSLGERMGSGLGGSGSGSGAGSAGSAGSGFGSKIGAGTSRGNGTDRTGNGAPRRSPGGSVELIDAPSSGKLYSDSILASTPGSSVITLAEESDYSRSRAGAGGASVSGGGGLAGRFDRSSKPRGRGQIGGGSFADMMVD